MPHDPIRVLPRHPILSEAWRLWKAELDEVAVRLKDAAQDVLSSVDREERLKGAARCTTLCARLNGLLCREPSA